MSFETIGRLRAISVIPVNTSGIDEYGNEVEVRGVPVRTRASREQVAADENTSDRNQQREQFVYSIKPTLWVSGRDLIEDSDETFKVIGPPKIVGSPSRRHHIEVKVERVEG